MAHKRAAEDSAEPSQPKRSKKGFHVGPQNLPDGLHKRKVDKIRRKLIENAKIRKSYDKLKAREEKQVHESANTPTEDHSAPITRHPARQALIDEDPESGPQEKSILENDQDLEATWKRKRHRRQQLYGREQQTARSRAQEFDKAREEAAASKAERDKRLQERERWRRTMANARGDGKRRKLGKESTVLLEKVKRMISKGNVGI